MSSVLARRGARAVVAGCASLPPSLHEYGPYRMDPFTEFLRVISGTYCSQCGLRSADGRLQQRHVFTTFHRCDLHPDEMEGMADPARRRAAVQYYTTPDPSHWPRYDEEGGKYVMLDESATAEQQQQPSMIDLPAAEAGTLAPVDIHLEVSISRLGGAQTVNMQKKSVIRAVY